MSEKHHARYQDEEQEQDGEKKDGQPPLLDKMIKTRTILVSGEINKELAERVVRQLLILEQEGDEPIRVFIDSPGGDADAGYAIFDTIRFVKPEVYTVGIGLVASAGALILLAGESCPCLASASAALTAPVPRGRASCLSPLIHRDPTLPRGCVRLVSSDS